MKVNGLSKYQLSFCIWLKFTKIIIAKYPRKYIKNIQIFVTNFIKIVNMCLG